MKTRLMGLPLAALAMALGAATASAQAPGLRPDAQGYLLAGGMRVDLDGLNGALAGRAFDEVASDMATMGGGGHITLGRWVLGGEGFGLLPREADNAARTWRARVTGGGGVLNVGYLVVRSGGTSLYPLAGIGVGAVALQMVERSNPTFEDVIANPGRESTMTQVVMLLQPALALDHFITVRNVEGVNAGVLLGIRAGYTFTPATSDFYLDQTRLPGGPDQGLQGPFVRVVIGGGTRRPADAGLANR